MDRWQALFWGSLIPVIIVQAFVAFNERYWTLSWADNILHLMWGFTIFLFFISYMRWQPKDAFLAVIAWQVFWELTELIGDVVFHTPPTSLHYDPYFFDGIKDTLFDIAAALFGWWMLRFTGEPVYERRVQRLRAWFVLLALGLIPLVIIGGVVSLITHHSANTLAIIWLSTLIPVTALYAFLHERTFLARRKEDA